MEEGIKSLSAEIISVKGRRVWDSRGRPTVESEIHLSDGSIGRAISPAGASMGSAEAVDKRDGGKSFGGLDVMEAVEAVSGEIHDALIGCDPTDQEGIDLELIKLDGTNNRNRLGGNALVATSMALAHAAAASVGLPLWRYLGGGRADYAMPLPEIQIFGGGAHAGRRVDIQDFMVIAIGAPNYRKSLEWIAEVYRSAGKLMGEAGKLAGVADEGGFWPNFNANEEALDFLLRAIEGAGFTPGLEVAISLDIAATDFGKGGKYKLATDNKVIDSDGLSEILLNWLEKYPIVSIEDPLGEDDPEAMTKFTLAVGPKVEVVADDFICTSATKIEYAASISACNTALIKPNQAGTLTEAKAALEAARVAGWDSIVSARSGESEDLTIVHLAVGWGVKQLKVGSFSRSERMAKWNEGLRIAENLENKEFDLHSRDTFPW